MRNWMELNDFYDKTVQLYDRQFGVLRFIVLLMVLLSVANTVNMSLFERVPEFGTCVRSATAAAGNEAGHDRGAGARRNRLGDRSRSRHRARSRAVGGGYPDAAAAEFEPGLHRADQDSPRGRREAGAVGVAATVLATIIAARRVTRFSIVDALRRSVEVPVRLRMQTCLPWRRGNGRDGKPMCVGAQRMPRDPAVLDAHQPVGSCHDFVVVRRKHECRADCRLIRSIRSRMAPPVP